jgi:uncharacterized iron-regulated membrane protein
MLDKTLAKTLTLTLIMTLAFAVWAGSAAAQNPQAAQECTWGQPGYRACVEAKISRMKQREAQGQPREVHKTVPASKRAPALTPIPDGSDAAAASGAPERPMGQAARRNRQWQFDLDQYRAQRDRRDPRAARRLDQLDLNRSIDAGASAGAQRQQQFDMNILRQQRDASPRPILPY